MSVNPDQPSERQLSLATIQPIDKIIVNFCHLLCFPGLLQLITPYVSIFQNVSFTDGTSIKIHQVDFIDFLKFLHRCDTLIQNVEAVQSKKVELKITISQIEFKLAHSEDDNFLLSISKENCQFQFDSRTIPDFLNAVSKLIFKSYGYSHNTNYVVSTFVQRANTQLLIKPNYNSCFAIFEKIDAIQVDYFLLYDIIVRHKNILLYVKRLEHVEDE